jgi:regulator of cell morphogenesis and NO signaling
MGSANVQLCTPLQQLMNEHVALRIKMDEFYEVTEEIDYESDTDIMELFTKLHEQILTFTNHLKAHSTKEEEGLFPLIQRRLSDKDKTIEVMEYEHHKAEQHLQDFLTEAAQWNETQDVDEARYLTVLAVQAYTTLIEHFAKEEKVLFPLAEKILSADEKEELKRFLYESSFHQ